MIDSIFHRSLLNDLEFLISKEPSFIANMANSAALIKMKYPHAYWIGFYLWDAELKMLLLGPFQGPPARTRIGMSNNICMRCVEEQTTQYNQCHDDIIELAIPLRQGRTVIGVFNFVLQGNCDLLQEDLDYLELCMARLISHHTM